MSVETVNRLEIEPRAGVEPGLCWPEDMRYRYNVRASEAWTVWGTVSGTQKRLNMIPWQDPPPDPPVYDNGLIALTMFEPGPDEDGNPRSVPRDWPWGFETDSGFTHARFAPYNLFSLAGPLLVVNDVNNEGGDEDRVFLLFEASNAMMEFFPEALEPTNFLLHQ